MLPFDLLDNSATEQSIIRCLIRRPHLTLAEIVEQIGSSEDEVAPLLEQLVDKSQVTRHLHNGKSTFSIRFASREAPRSNGLLDTLYG